MTDRTEALLRTDERRRLALINSDLAELDSCLSPDLVLVHTSGSLDSKRSFMDKIEAGTLRYLDIEHIRCSVELYSTVGVQTTVSRMKVTVNGTGKEFQCRTMGVWLWARGQWLLRQYQTTAMLEELQSLTGGTAESRSKPVLQ